MESIVEEDEFLHLHSDATNPPPVTPSASACSDDAQGTIPHLTSTPELPTVAVPNTSALDSPAEGSPLPRTDAEGALCTLKGNEWLSSTAIEVVQRALRVDPATLFLDPLVFNVEDPGLPSFRHPERVTQIMLPLLHRGRKHWTLAVFDIAQGVVRHYDSLDAPELPQANAALLEFANMVDPNVTWRFEATHPIHQLDGFNCGVYVLITMACLVLELPLPSVVSPRDMLLWRYVFGIMIAVTTVPSLVERSLEEQEARIRDAQLALAGWIRFTLETQSSVQPATPVQAKKPGANSTRPHELSILQLQSSATQTTCTPSWHACTISVSAHQNLQRSFKSR